MLLSTLAAALADAGVGAVDPARPIADVEVTDVEHDSRAVRPGSLFCCVRGSSFDGHDLAGDAVASGAVALLVDRSVDVDVPQIVVPDVRRAMGPAASAVHGHPSHAMTVIGVTGTNGKTTTVAMLRSIFLAAGRRVEIVGTLAPLPGGLPTSPEAPVLQRQFATWRAQGVEVVAMEVSSHALAVGRVDGTRFAAAGFTTLGVDHLDFHGDVEAYFAAKARLFTSRFTGRAVVRADDGGGARLLAQLDPDVIAVPYALADAEPVVTTTRGTSFRWAERRTVVLPLFGDHNVANALCAATLASSVGVPDDAIVDGLEQLPPIAGRFELVETAAPFTVAVDYAHTPDALEATLRAARGIADATGGRVLVVFGCGGDRDTGKRPMMGRLAAELADVAIITSDNPRSEDPQAIISDVLAGIDRTRPDTARIVSDPDRSSAIHHAAREARNADVVVVAGKGHETTQTFADRVVDFDDRVVVGAAVAEVWGEGDA